MGGGDLNLKKSWHPSTFANLEKVWKAEQRDESERKKIAQLQQELKEERTREDIQRSAIDAGVIKQKESRVDWLYSGPASSVNREEYLLGKKIDKLVDPTITEAEREKEALSSGPGALFVGGATGANSGTDLTMKIREDPLFLIKQKEEEAKKKLASNPIKLKQLQQLLATERKGGSGPKKKKKKHKRSREEYSESPPRTRNDHSPSHFPPTKSHSHHHQGHSYSKQENSRKQTSSSTSGPASRYQPYSKPRSRTKGMDPEELEKRRQEMMDNAKDHDREREKRLRRHEQERQKSKDLAQTEREDFLQPLRVQSLSSSGSLGDRIHRNINSVQRTSAKLDSNFMSK